MRRRRTALPLLAASAAAIALVAWPALAAATAAGATAGGSAAVPAGTPACTDRWVGLASSPQWTIPSNWSTGEVPGPSSDVCITTTGDDVLTDVSIRIHSLQIGSEQGIALEGTPAKPLTAEVAEDVDLTPGFFGRIDMTDARIDAAQIDDQGGTIYTDGTCALDSTDVVFGSGGILDADGGTTTVTGLPQLSDGTLTGGTISALGAVVVLPGDVSHLVSAHVTVAENSAVDDPAGDNALTGLTSIDAQSSLTDESDLPLTGSLVADGNVSFGGPAVSLAGTLTQAEGTLSEGTNLSASQVLIDPGATLETVGGTIAGDLVNQGTVDNFGTTGVTGNYTQARAASLDTGFGEPLEVAGTADLAGSLTSGEPIPRTGDSSAVITFGSSIGRFASHNPGFVLVTQPGEIEEIIFPQLAASPASVAPGGSVTVTGGSFSEAPLNIYLDHATGTPLATTSIGYFGRFSVVVAIPSSTTPGPHELVATGPDDDTASTMITVS